MTIPNGKKLLTAWLWTGLLMVLLMVVVGGITRLTGSGLSIVKWKIVTGVLPPLNEAAWETSFQEYRQTPQFIQINKNFTLHDFKGIYWWEYVHRLVGRIIGVVFIVPFLFLMIQGKLSSWLLRQLVFILILGALQGLMGWIMVRSGLNDLPYVSHYRLAIHLCLALMLTGVIYWTILKTNSYHEQSGTRPWLIYATVGILVFQIILGAFVAGLKAGFYYNTFPLMGGSFMPANMFSSMQNGVLIQFVHRWFAFVFAGSALVIFWRYRNKRAMARPVKILLTLTIIQILLGVITLLYKVPVSLGVLHQLTAFLIFINLVALVFHAQYPPDKEQSFS